PIHITMRKKPANARTADLLSTIENRFLAYVAIAQPAAVFRQHRRVPSSFMSKMKAGTTHYNPSLEGADDNALDKALCRNPHQLFIKFQGHQQFNALRKDQIPLAHPWGQQRRPFGGRDHRPRM